MRGSTSPSHQAKRIYYLLLLQLCPQYPSAFPLPYAVACGLSIFHMKTGDPDGNGVDDTIIGAAGNADELCLIPQAVGTTKEQAALFIAAGNLGTTVTGEIDFEKQPLFVVTDTIPAAYQAIYERF